MALNIQEISANVRGVFQYVPERSIVYFAVCLFGLLLLLFGGILPAERSIANLDRKTSDLKRQIEEQNTLLPYYLNLKKVSDGMKQEALPFPVKVPMPKNSVHQIISMLKEEARKAGMEAVSVSADMNAAAGGNATRIPVAMTVKGEFVLFRTFLLGLGAIPSFESIEEMQIQQRSGTLEYTLKIWIAMG